MKNWMVILSLLMVVGLACSAFAIPKVYIDDLRITLKSTTAAPGIEFPEDTITVTAKIKNIGNEAGAYSIRFNVSGASPATWDTANQTLAAGATKTWSKDFTISYNYPDTNQSYTVQALLNPPQVVTSIKTSVLHTTVRPLLGTPMTPIGR
jgi:hypothetical protein